MLYVEAVRQWILPVMGATAATKYLGLPLRWSIITWVAFALLAEAVAVLFGWLERRTGATRANYGLSRDTDPFKQESLELATRTAREVRALRVIAIAIHAALAKRRESDAR